MTNRYGVPAGTIARLRLELRHQASPEPAHSGTSPKSENPAPQDPPAPPNRQPAPPNRKSEQQNRQSTPPNRQCSAACDEVSGFDRPKAARPPTESEPHRGKEDLAPSFAPTPQALPLGGEAPPEEQEHEPASSTPKPKAADSAETAEAAQAKVSERVKLWRSHLRVTQRQAADLLGLSLSAYQTLERGARFTDGRPVRLDERTILAMLWLAGLHSGRIPRRLASELAQAMGWDEP